MTGPPGLTLTSSSSFAGPPLDFDTGLDLAKDLNRLEDSFLRSGGLDDEGIADDPGSFWDSVLADMEGFPVAEESGGVVFEAVVAWAVDGAGFVSGGGGRAPVRRLARGL